jgi:hypothetical protein
VEEEYAEGFDEAASEDGADADGEEPPASSQTMVGEGLPKEE